MTPFLKKEIRLLLPAFMFALAIAVAGIFFHGENGSRINSIGYFLGGIFFPAVVVMLALNSFGTEIGTQMFAMMLAQPVERQRVWQTKIVLLAISLVFVAIVWVVSTFVTTVYSQNNLGSDDVSKALASVALFGMVVFSGALWPVLLLRQVAAAFWFTLIVPGALLALVALFCSGSSDELVLAMAAVVLGAYSLAGFFFARWLFFRAQDLQWTGGAIVMPEWLGLNRLRTAAGSLRMWRPYGALWRKEIQLHQSQLVIAFVLFVLHLLVLLVRNVCNLDNSHDLKSVLQGFWVLWLVMPFLVGCAAVAEERKLGVHEGQLCLPVRRPVQFIVKSLTALVLSILLGMVMPMILEAHQFSLDHPRNLSDWLILSGIPPLICAIAFYVSTMARNTLQTLAPAVLGFVLIWPLILITTLQQMPLSDYSWRGPLGAYIILPTFALTLLFLAYFNFQRVLTGWSLVGRNVLIIICSLVLSAALTSATYHRFWEELTSSEPAHGQARLFLPQSISLKSDPTGLSASLPDGRIWTAPVVVQPRPSLGDFKVSSPEAGNLPGTNWLVFDHDYWLAAGIQNDGTLWVSKYPRLPGPNPDKRDGLNKNKLNDLVQVGTESNWRSLLPVGYSLYLIKDNGTLWRLGGNRDYKAGQWPAAQNLKLGQVGTESDWAGFDKCGYEPCFYKADGTAWITGNWTTNNQASIKIGLGYILHAVPPLDHHQMRSTATIVHGLSFAVGIRNDGTFRIWGHPRIASANLNNYEWSVTDQQIGTVTNWVAVAGTWDKAVTLKNDGTLWVWDFRRNQFHNWDPVRLDAEVAKTVPVRLSTRSDWIAISDDFALAADGSVWFWPLIDPSQLSNFLWQDQDKDYGQNRVPLLDISRKPQLLGNIFTAAN